MDTLKSPAKTNRQEDNDLTSTPNAASSSLSTLEIDDTTKRSPTTSSPDKVDTITKLVIPAHKLGAFIQKHEIPRKVFHSSIGFVTLWLYTQGIQISQVTPHLVVALVVVASSDYIRFKNRAFNKLYIAVMGPLMRQKEIDSYNGVIFYLAGLIFVFSLFPKDIALISLLLLSWADTSASTFGRAFGYLTPKIGPNKSLAGSIAAFATGIVSAVILYQYFIPKFSYYNSSSDIMWKPENSILSFPLFTLCCGFIGAFSEAIDIQGIDDNLTIPVLSAIGLYTIVRLTSST